MNRPVSNTANALEGALEGAVGGAAIALMVNGEPRQVAAGAVVADLLAQLALPPGKVAVELNREIVPKSRFAAQALAEGDQVEIVHFVGGG
jgi:thiamine biosynthesis protein ThiS